LYAYQLVLKACCTEVYGIDSALQTRRFDALLRLAIVGEHAPEKVILLEIDPLNPKTLPDFRLTEKLCGIRTADIRDVRREGNKLYFEGRPVHRIYNRAIADKLVRRDWAGHPNWFFLVSKYLIPFLLHETVPEPYFLDRIPAIPDDLNNRVLKPLYSFARLGVKVGPTREREWTVTETSNRQARRRASFHPYRRVALRPQDLCFRFPVVSGAAEGGVPHVGTDDFSNMCSILK
jgi:hypothetical protein